MKIGGMLKSKLLTVELEVEKGLEVEVVEEVEVEVGPWDLELNVESESELVSGVEDSVIVAE